MRLEDLQKLKKGDLVLLLSGKIGTVDHFAYYDEFNETWSYTENPQEANGVWVDIEEKHGWHGKCVTYGEIKEKIEGHIMISKHIMNPTRIKLLKIIKNAGETNQQYLEKVSYQKKGSIILSLKRFF